MTRCNNHTITSMYTNRVNIFHIANNYCIACFVTHNLKLYFLITGYTLFYKNLSNTRGFNTTCCYFLKFSHCFSNTATCTTQSISRSNNDRQTIFFCKLNCIFNFTNNNTINNRFAYFKHSVFKHFSIFSLFDSFHISTKKSYIMLF